MFLSILKLPASASFFVLHVGHVERLKGELVTMKKYFTTTFIVQAAMIAALYCVLTAIAAGFDLASGAIQVRFSEALTILPFFTPAAIPGVTIGCFLANLITGGAMPDVIFGTLATLIGAVGSWLLRKPASRTRLSRVLVSLPPIISNALIIPFILRYAYEIPGSIPFFMLTVGAGEVISAGIGGQILLAALEPFKSILFGEQQ